MTSNHRSDEKRYNFCVGSHARPSAITSNGKTDAFRMLDTYKPNTEDMQGHIRVYKDFQEIMELHSL
jgi:hypothetical protein